MKKMNNKKRPTNEKTVVKEARLKEYVDPQFKKIRSSIRVIAFVVAAGFLVLAFSCTKKNIEPDYSGTYTSSSFCGQSLTFEISKSGEFYTIEGTQIEIIDGKFSGIIQGVNHEGEFSSNGKTLDYKQSLSGTTCNAIFQKK